MMNIEIMNKKKKTEFTSVLTLFQFCFKSCCLIYVFRRIYIYIHAAESSLLCGVECLIILMSKEEEAAQRCAPMKAAWLRESYKPSAPPAPRNPVRLFNLQGLNPEGKKVRTGYAV